MLSSHGMFDLARFRKAQDSPDDGFAQALRELQAGHKTSHWIWYVFPQLAALGRSSMAQRYGLAGAGEARAYLEDRVLADRLLQATAAVRGHLSPAGGRPARLEHVMGSRIDALKLVSSMTLFAGVARRAALDGARPDLATLAEHADAILTSARAQGFDPCPVTLAHLAGETP